MITKTAIFVILIYAWIVLPAHADNTKTTTVDLESRVAQLELLRIQQREAHTPDMPSMASALITHDEFVASINTFPAVSLDESRFALLIEPSPQIPAVIMEIRDRSGKTIKSFDIVAEEDGYRMYSDPAAMEKVRENISNANEYLAQHQYKPMQPLFRKSFLPGSSMPTSVTDADGWTYPINTAKAILRVENYHFSFSLEELRITRAHSRLNWRIDVPTGYKTYPAPPDSGPDNDCHVSVHPAEGWVSEESKVIVIRIMEISANSCDMPDEWRIYPFPE